MKLLLRRNLDFTKVLKYKIRLEQIWWCVTVLVCYNALFGQIRIQISIILAQLGFGPVSFSGKV